MICGLPLSIIWPFEIGTPFETTLDENYSVPCWLYWKQFLILHYKTNIIHLTACMSQKLIESKKDFFFEKTELAWPCPFDYFTFFCRLFLLRWLFSHSTLPRYKVWLENRKCITILHYSSFGIRSCRYAKANSVEYTPPLSDLIVAELSHLEPGYLRHDELCGQFIQTSDTVYSNI